METLGAGGRPPHAGGVAGSRYLILPHNSPMGSSYGETVADLPLLATKLHVPGWRPGFVSRPRLVAALERGAGRKLTLVSAGAGFGKTTLLAEWLATTAAGERPVAWVSLD